jgi:uncharacterized protein DUF4157
MFARESRGVQGSSVGPDTGGAVAGKRTLTESLVSDEGRARGASLVDGGLATRPTLDERAQVRPPPLIGYPIQRLFGRPPAAEPAGTAPTAEPAGTELDDEPAGDGGAVGDHDAAADLSADDAGVDDATEPDSNDAIEAAHPEGALSADAEPDGELDGEVPAQARAGTGGLDVDAPLPASTAGVALQPQVRGRMEDAFQADFSGVTIHPDSPRAAGLGALAYTEGASVHMAPGQYDPGSRSGSELLGHELAHVVQQREGRVSATGQAKGLALNDDPALEQEADDRGQRAAAGEVVARAPGLLPPGHAGPVQMARPVLQMGKNHKNRKNRRNRKGGPGAPTTQPAPGSIGKPNRKRKGGTGKPGTPVVAGARRFKPKKTRPTKTVTLNFTRMHGGTGDAGAAINYTNNIYRRADIQVVKGTESSVDKPGTEADLGLDLELEEYPTPSAPTAEERKLFRRNQTAGAVTVYFVKGLSAGSLGEAFWPALGHGFVGVAVGNSGTPNTVSHELGHVLLDSGDHTVPDDTYLMHATATAPTKLTRGEQTKMRSSPYAK